MEDIVLVGFGGHAKSVIDSIERAKKFHIIGFTDIVAQKEYRGYKYLGNDDVLQKYFDEGIKCAAVTLGYMGTGKIRDYLYYRLKRIGFCLPVIIDSSSVLAEDVIIKEGTFVGKNCVINSASEIGSMCIINTGAVIEHESYVGDFSHVSVNATLCGSVMLGEHCFVGANSTIIQNVRVESECIIGAGSVVLGDVAIGQKVFGIVKKSDF